MSPSIWQILIVVLIVVVLFGAGRIPRIMEDLGRGIQSFRKGLRDGDSDANASLPPKDETKDKDKDKE